MNLQDRISALAILGDFITSSYQDQLQAAIATSMVDNPWFTKEGAESALLTIAQQFLVKDKLEKWLSNYALSDDGVTFKNVGLVLAGNIPLVGWHDVICVFLSGHRSIIKYSAKDKALISRLIEELERIDPRTKEFFAKVEKLSGVDAVIATGGDTAATHFHYYFGKYPHIIRKNRSSVAILTNETTQEDIKKLGADIFDYFGLGCRSVSKVYVPQDFVMDRLFEGIVDYGFIIDHHKYKNNYDYTYSIYLLGKEPFLTNNFLNVRESDQLVSRISCLHYERYDNMAHVESALIAQQESLQCIVSQKPIGDLTVIPYGMSQKPALDDYADGVDTMDFLSKL